MKSPLPRGSAIDMRRVSGWLADFTGYRHAVTEPRIDRWLNQFQRRDRDLGARILDTIDFVTEEKISSAFRSILADLDGWNQDASQRRGKWRFVAFSSSAGESGDTMIHKFRIANRLSYRRFDSLFIYKRDLLAANLGPDDTVVFIDDFSGRGKQVTDAWEENIRELLPGNPRIFIVFVAISEEARQKIENETSLMVVSNFELTDADDIFSDSCQHFTEAEKDTLLHYCRTADNQLPRGSGDCGFVIVFPHRCPNNSVPILHSNHPRWEGLFRRND